MWILIYVLKTKVYVDHKSMPFSNLKQISGTNNRNKNRGKIFMDVWLLVLLRVLCP